MLNPCLPATDQGLRVQGPMTQEQVNELRDAYNKNARQELVIYELKRIQ